MSDGLPCVRERGFRALMGSESGFSYCGGNDMKINSGRAPISSRNLNRQFRLQSISEKKSDEPEFSQRGDTG